MDRLNRRRFYIRKTTEQIEELTKRIDSIPADKFFEPDFDQRMRERSVLTRKLLTLKQKLQNLKDGKPLNGIKLDTYSHRQNFFDD